MSVDKLLDIRCLENRWLARSSKIKLLPSIPIASNWIIKLPTRQISVAYNFLCFADKFNPVER